MEYEQRFDSYRIWYYSHYGNDALIQLYSSGRYVGQITFERDRPDGTLISPNSANNDRINL